MKVLDFPNDVNPSKMKEVNKLMKKSTETIFGLDDSKLRYTSHRIDHQPINQMPYWISTEIRYPRW